MRPVIALSRVWRLPPRRGESGWKPLIWLGYLGFLFMPLADPQESRHWLWATLLTLPPFLVLYVRRCGTGPRGGLLEPLGFAALCYALSPYNPYANTYLIYAAAYSGLAPNGLRRALLITTGLLTLYAIEVWVLHLPVQLIAMTVLISLVVLVANSLYVENSRKNAALRTSHQEIRRLAAVAERERIGRDLHDLLGSTLSLIAIKSELAGKLLARNRDDAAREIADVTDIARQALKQVRTAVTGIRSASMQTELASARLLLESSGIAVNCQTDAVVLGPEVETALAMIIREAITNIQRHAYARQARIEISAQGADVVLLSIADDGRGGVTRYGNGLSGIAERVRTLGGRLDIESLRGQGTRLRASLPSSSEVAHR